MTATAAALLQGVDGEPVVLEAVTAEAELTNLMADVTVIQTYRNPHETPIEAVYTFPLPVDAVLLDVEAVLGERRLAGTVVEKAAAERRYEDAITDGDFAVLLERAAAGLYTASVGNLLPGETATLRFRYGQLLRWNGNRVRFMLRTTIAPRYGDPAAARLARYQVPEYTFDARRAFKLRVTVRGLLAGARFNSPSHALRITQDDAGGGGETLIALDGTPSMNQHFVLEALAARPEVPAAIAAPERTAGWCSQGFRPEIPPSQDARRRSVKIVVTARPR